MTAAETDDKKAFTPNATARPPFVSNRFTSAVLAAYQAVGHRLRAKRACQLGRVPRLSSHPS